MARGREEYGGIRGGAGKERARKGGEEGGWGGRAGQGRRKGDQSRRPRPICTRLFTTIASIPSAGVLFTPLPRFHTRGSTGFIRGHTSVRRLASSRIPLACHPFRGEQKEKKKKRKHGAQQLFTQQFDTTARVRTNGLSGSSSHSCHQLPRSTSPLKSLVAKSRG